LETIPLAWIDVPDAPFVARMRRGRAVLVNRSRQVFKSVSTGCVVERSGYVTVVSGLFSSDIDHGGYGSGSQVEGLLRIINNIDVYLPTWGPVAGLRRCEPAARVAVIGASHDDGG
jgi:hypothetical protein